MRDAWRAFTRTMSVYTTVEEAALQEWLTRYDVGPLAALEPIAAGIENTNYFVTTTGGQFVLTLYERLPASELPFYLNFMAHLAGAGVEVPAPVRDRTGALFSMLSGKPAGLVQRVPGRAVDAPDAMHCSAVGSALARLHLASATYPARLSNRRGPPWWREAARAVTPWLDTSQRALLDDSLDALAGYADYGLPQGAIHGDLFCDNVLFACDRVSGIIDFGFAATDYYAYDLAITVNEWCLAPGRTDGALDPALLRAMVAAYARVRPLAPEERGRWPMLLRAAALRFWLSRLYDLHLPRSGELTHAHDPSSFERILRHRVEWPVELPLVDDAPVSS